MLLVTTNNYHFINSNQYSYPSTYDNTDVQLQENLNSLQLFAMEMIPISDI